MGIQNYHFTSDFMHNLEKPNLFIAKKNKEIVCSLPVCEALSFTFNLNAYQTVSFSVNQYVNGEEYTPYPNIKEGRYLFVQSIGWYEMHVTESNDGSGWVKEVTATSIEIELSRKRLVNFEINTDAAITDDDYQIVKFYNAGNPDASLLNKVLKVDNNWTVGHVDSALCDKQRTFDISDSDVYSVLTSDIAEAFECLFIFDTFERTVNAYVLDDYGTNTNIHVSNDNFAQSINRTVDENSIVTCLRINGGDGVYVNEVNPNGTNKIYNFQYYVEDMSPALQTKLATYNQTYQSYTNQYETLMLNMSSCMEDIAELYNRAPASELSTNWTEYGITLLIAKKQSFENIETIYKSQGADVATSPMYQAYLNNHQTLTAVDAELSTKTTEVGVLEAQLESYETERATIQSALDMDEYFTVNEWKELGLYVVESSYDNDNFSITESTTDDERLDITKQLLAKAIEELEKASIPQYQYESSLFNFMTIPEMSGFLSSFELGNYINLHTNYDVIVPVRLISFTVDFASTDTMSVTFSTSTKVKNAYSDMASVLSQASSAAVSFNFNKDQYDKSSRTSNQVRDMRTNGLDVAQQRIQFGSHQEQTWDSAGMTFREWDTVNNRYKGEQLKILNNIMCFSDDGFQTVKTAIGKIDVGNGNTAYGMNCEVLIGNMILGNNLKITNSGSNVTIDGSGITTTSSTQNVTVKINPNDASNVFSISKGSTKMLYVDSTTGNLVFNGELGASVVSVANKLSVNNGISSVVIDAEASDIFKIKRGSVELMKLSSLGNLTLAGSVITSPSISQGSITGTSMNVNDKFIVDSQGNLTATSGTFSGTINGSSISGSSFISGGSTMGAANSIYVGDSNIKIYNGSASEILNLNPTGFTFHGIGRFGQSMTISMGSDSGGIKLNGIGLYSTSQNIIDYSGMSIADYTYGHISIGSGKIEYSSTDLTPIVSKFNNQGISTSGGLSVTYQAEIGSYLSVGSYIQASNNITSLGGLYAGNSNASQAFFEASTDRLAYRSFGGLNTYWSVTSSMTTSNVPLVINNAGVASTADTLVVANGTIKCLAIYNNHPSSTQSPNVYIGAQGHLVNTVSSSRRYKHDINDNIEKFDYKNLLKLPVRSFIYNDDYLSEDSEIRNVPIIGFIAEEVAELFPQGAEYNEDGTVEMWNYKTILPAMLKLIQEQDLRIKELERKIS